MIKKLIKNKGLFQFLLRTIIFALAIFGAYLFVMLYFRHTMFFLKYLRLPDNFYFDFLSGLRKRDFMNSAMFTGILFLIWNRNILLKLKSYSRDRKQTLIFAGLAVLTQLSHYLFKYWIKINNFEGTLLLTSTKYIFNIAFIITAAIAVYNLELFKDLFPKIKKQIPFFALVMAAYFFIIQFFQAVWGVLGNFIARTICFLLNLTLKGVYLKISPGISPKLGYGDFIVGISQECSGIDSLLLFISLFSVLLILDWKRMYKKRAVALFAIGLIGTIAYNILRIYLLMLVGIFYSPEFAVDMFHTNAGWILFLLFFIVFWHFGSKWVYKKEKI
ncbi:MAG: archaeosortase/exosortase family protein [Nanoarchaeota archaeon]|nr:archaeosortase/exosortase family protein [Nanoarchaeota archaeon]